MSGYDSAMIERRRKLLGPAYKLFYDNPVHIVRGEGVWLYDADGRRYLDMYNNVPHVGHCHPRVVRAGQRVGLSGSTGRVTGPHLHWGAKIGDRPFDPTALLDDRLFP